MNLYAKASNPGKTDLFGRSVAISNDGTTLAVGAYLEDTTAKNSGAVYVFTYSSGSWSQQAFLKNSNPTNHDYLGYSGGIKRRWLHFNRGSFWRG